jgi:hypothetical protein
MGGASGRQYIIEEQLKPRSGMLLLFLMTFFLPFALFFHLFFFLSDVSDIPDGDWQAAKLEVERLRGLISRV